MSYLQEWAKGKPQILVIIAQQLAVGAEAFREFLIALKTGEPIDAASMMLSREHWLRFYTHHKRIQQSVFDSFQELGRFSDSSTAFETFLLGVLRCMRTIELKKLRQEMESLDPETRKELIDAGRREMWTRYRLPVVDMGSDAGAVMDPGLEKKFNALLEKPEIVFFGRVWLPCWFCYGESPTALFRRARHGDKDAWRKLARFDRLVLDNPLVSKRIQDESPKEKRTEATRIATDLPVVIPPRNVKYAIAGLISHIALSLGEDLTKAEIRGLFDALSREQQESERDSDFPQAADELDKIIDQECRFWSGAPVPGEQ